MGYEFNKLYDPRMRNNVCVSGQLFLIDLIEKFETIKGVKLVQSNTDGILLQYTNDFQLNQIKKECEKWSKRTRFNLGYDYFDKIIQKDVNNYIALGEYDVFVGGYIKDQNELDNDLPIINTALREYFINNIPARQTIEMENKLIEFQKIVKVSSKFDYATHNRIRVPEKTLRVFASKVMTDTKVESFRHREGKDEYNKFSGTSDNSFIDNSDVTEKLIPSKLDKEWYVELAERRVGQYKGEIK